jgi:hypothetical protein
MVLTVPVRNGMGLPRRSVLAATAGVAGLAGCSVPHLLSEDPAPQAMPDADALRAVSADSLLLAARYDAAITAQPDLAARLTPLRDAHREHAAAIGRALDSSAGPAGPAPSASRSAAPARDRAALLKALATDERAAADRAGAACLAAAAYRAPLLGTIAACRASHAEALS